MKLVIFKNIDDLQKYCAQKFIDQVKTQPNSVIGFATGVSPIEAYKYIIKDHQFNHTSWKNVTTFNLDEFVGIDPTHPEAFIQQMRTNLFNHIDVKPQNIHIPNSQAAIPEMEANNYEKLIAQNPIDFQYISLGINGHMAYNEPGTPFESFTHVTNLTRETIEDMIAKAKFTSYQDSPKQAITMGVQTILKHTKRAIMVAYGKHKALVTKQMLEDRPNSQVTASYLQLHPNCEFVIDAAAASLLSPETLAKAERR
ncbi:glucosamine-6-phosphate deaminase [Candidatus Mycoplasma pogonae]